MRSQGFAVLRSPSPIGQAAAIAIVVRWYGDLLVRHRSARGSDRTAIDSNDSANMKP
jgi:hypothetical protein